jgi:hypothetical protein
MTVATDSNPMKIYPFDDLHKFVSLSRKAGKMSEWSILQVSITTYFPPDEQGAILTSCLFLTEKQRALFLSSPDEPAAIQLLTGLSIRETQPLSRWNFKVHKPFTQNMAIIVTDELALDESFSLLFTRTFVQGAALNSSATACAPAPQAKVNE